LLFLLLGCHFFLRAQNNYHIQFFTTENGLPSNGIKGLQYDEQTGFLWIATEAGITRYNGTDFKTFSRTNTPGLYSERMLFLLKTRDGRLYTSDEVGNLFFIMQNQPQFIGQVRVDARPTTFRLIGLAASSDLFRQSSEKPPADFGFDFTSEQLIPLSEHRILFTHRDALYDYRMGGSQPGFLLPLASGSKICYLNGKLFAFSPKDGFCRIYLDSLRKEPVTLSGDKETTAVADRKAVNPGRTFIPSADTQLFWENGMRHPILISGSDAWIVEEEEGVLVRRSICTALPAGFRPSYAKYDSATGLLFLGTESKGFLVIRKNLVLPIKHPAATLNLITACYSQVGLPGGAILTSQGTVFSQPSIAPSDDKAGTPTGIPPDIHLPIRGAFNNFVYTAPDGVLWYSQNDSVYSYSYRTGHTLAMLAGAGSITDGFVRSEGHIYIANAIGIGMVHGDSIDYQYRYPKSDINSNVPFSMVEMSPGLIAIATCKGLFRFNILSHQVDTLWTLPGICVRALWKYKGYLFIGTYGRGIYLLKDGEIKHIPGDKNGYLQYAHCFIPDKQGYCWISTNKGLFRTSPEDLTEAFDKNSREVYYRYYGRPDGMEMTELNGGCTPCALPLNDTTLSFPSMDGLVWVDPTLPVTGSSEGSIYIDDFMADLQPVNITSLMKPDLPAGTRDLSFSLGYPAWVTRENLYIDYKLEPYSKDWQAVDIENNPKLRFSNLPSGSYHLQLRMLNGNGNRYSFATCNFYIIPHWYQQLWFWVFCLCLLSAIIGGIVRWRTFQFHTRQSRLETQIAEKTRELQAKNQELEKTDHIKTRLISIISHDLVTPLRFLHLTGKSLIEKKQGLTEGLQQEMIAEMATTSKELELLSTNILNWIKYRNEDRRLAKETFNLHELVSQLFSIFNAMARQKNIRLINGIDEELSLYQFIDPVKIVLYNLILNGINFTSEGYIQISCLGSRAGITIFIEDTGVGMTQEQINNIMANHFIISSANVDNRKGNGLGYLIIKDLLKIVRGNLTIQSEKDKGTRVMVWVPM
jgi:signal transduction histidine kinase